MVRSINEIGHLTGKQTIAEFAENAEITNAHQSRRRYAQGYGVAQPQRVLKSASPEGAAHSRGGSLTLDRCEEIIVAVLGDAGLFFLLGSQVAAGGGCPPCMYSLDARDAGEHAGAGWPVATTKQPRDPSLHP